MKWIKDISWFEGDEMPEDYAYDMADNARYEEGLVEYVRKMIEKEGGYEAPLERIRYDIEAQLG